MSKTIELNGWAVGQVMTYPAETAEALEHHVATDLAGILHDAGVQAGDRDAALAALAGEQVNPLLISQCFTRAMTLLAGARAPGGGALRSSVSAAP